MRVTVQPDDWGRNVNIWLFEEDFGSNAVRVAHLLEDNVIRMDPVPEGVQPNPTLILPRELAAELASAILGKAGTIHDELVETLKIERARVDKLLDKVTAPVVLIRGEIANT